MDRLRDLADEYGPGAIAAATRYCNQLASEKQLAGELLIFSIFDVREAFLAGARQERDDLGGGRRC